MNEKKINQFIKYLAVALISSVAILALITGLNYDDFYLKQLIKNQFYYDFDMNKIENASKTALVEALGDKHTFYISEELGYDHFQETVSGNYVGIGVSISTAEKNPLEILHVSDKSPAQKAGILAGDIIIKVDNVDVTGLKSSEVISLIKKEKGEKVSLCVLRNGEEKTFEIKIDSVNTTNVMSKKIGDIGYVYVATFDNDINVELKNHIDKLGNIKGLVIDLRDNPGGLLSSVVDSLDLFIDEGDFIKIRYKNKKETVFSATKSDSYKMPLVVLTNKNSASAAELFAAAIKDNKRGISIGTLTYGKGSVQRNFPLGNNTGINLTIANFFSPNGNAINNVGVAPDIEVNLPEAYLDKNILSIPENDDTQIQEAIKYLNK